MAQLIVKRLMRLREINHGEDIRERLFFEVWLET
jgi:hypothetical protein